VARIETYEETPDIHKEAFVREEVKVKKVVDQETVEAQETLREELDVDTEGRLVVDGSNSGENKSKSKKRSSKTSLKTKKRFVAKSQILVSPGLTHVPAISLRPSPKCLDSSDS